MSSVEGNEPSGGWLGLAVVFETSDAGVPITRRFEQVAEFGEFWPCKVEVKDGWHG